MDVLHFLKSDHDAIRTGLDRLDKSDGLKVRRAVLDELARRVQVHMVLERDYLYPEIAELFAGVDALVAIGLANASQISRRMKVLVKLLGQPASEQAGYPKRLDELRESVLQHFEHEEQNLLPKLRYLIRTEDREDLGQVFMDAQDELMKTPGGAEVAPVASAARRKRA